MDFQHDYEMINGRRVLKKHVATIHCTNKLSLLERKISNALLYHAFPHLKNQLIHEITLEKLKRLLGANTRNHQALKDALKTLISTVIEWNLLNDEIPELELEGWNASTILSSVSIHRGIIKYQYSKLIKTLITDPSVYGKINLLIQSRFKSSYALALYENCSRYRGLSHTKNIDMFTFRKLMGVEDGKYDIFRDFNRRVLQPAVNEINTCSDIRVTPNISRRGRKIQSIQFRIEERPIKQRIGIQNVTENHVELQLPGLDKKIIHDFECIYGFDAVHKAITYVKSCQSYQDKTIKNMAAYLKAAIEKNFQSHETKDTKSTKPLSEAQRKEIQWRLHKHNYIQYISKEMVRQFALLKSQKQKALIAELLQNGVDVLGQQAELLTTVYYDLLGSTDDRIQQAIQQNNLHLITFFENGFCEFLLIKEPSFKEHVCDFDTFILKQSTDNKVFA